MKTVKKITLPEYVEMRAKNTLSLVAAWAKLYKYIDPLIIGSKDREVLDEVHKQIVSLPEDEIEIFRQIVIDMKKMRFDVKSKMVGGK